MAQKKARKSRKPNKVINLKGLTRTRSEATLKRALKAASGRKIAIIVLNAPFKLAA